MEKRYDTNGSAIGFGILAAVFSPWILAYYGFKLLEETLEDLADNLPDDVIEAESAEPVGGDGVYVDIDSVFGLDQRRN